MSSPSFEAAQSFVRAANHNVFSEDVIATLYGLEKQAVDGPSSPIDSNSLMPDLYKKSWHQCRHLTPELARRQFVDVLDRYCPNWKFKTPITGHIHKQGNFIRTWNRRYFILVEKTLMYKKVATNSRPKGVFDLKECSIMEVGEQNGYKSMCLIKSGEALFYLRAPADLASEWYHLIDDRCEGPKLLLSPDLLNRSRRKTSKSVRDFLNTPTTPLARHNSTSDMNSDMSGVSTPPLNRSSSMISPVKHHPMLQQETNSTTPHHHHHTPRPSTLSIDTTTNFSTISYGIGEDNLGDISDVEVIHEEHDDDHASHETFQVPISTLETNRDLSMFGDLDKETIEVSKRKLKELEEYSLSDEGWKPNFKKNGVECFTRPSSDIPTAKGKGIVHRPLEEVLYLLADLDAKKTIDPQFEKGHIVKEYSPQTRIDYLRFKPVWPTTARDFTNITVWQKNPSTGGVAFLGCSMETELMLPIKKFVRADLQLGGWYLKPIDENTTELIFIVFTDLKGKLPSSIVKKVTSQQPMAIAAVEEYFKKHPEYTHRTPIGAALPTSPSPPQQCSLDQIQNSRNNPTQSISDISNTPLPSMKNSSSSKNKIASTPKSKSRFVARPIETVGTPKSKENSSSLQKEEKYDKMENVFSKDEQLSDSVEANDYQPFEKELSTSNKQPPPSLSLPIFLVSFLLFLTRISVLNTEKVDYTLILITVGLTLSGERVLMKWLQSTNEEANSRNAKLENETKNN
eukprot:TRINITY_DN781806_c0_g1_i1.p1 TRINITY_DN781806_c0_g1~~TRINITY_DN781806_c0_g1_i1.p1  ORF type:complete len:740 (+),score=195.31 TRINITY_DN781806_c0_g1_i1:122-2341(+)